MDFQILYAIQGMHTPAFDTFILAVTKITGSLGQIWLILAALLLIFKKTRKTGFCILFSYVLVFLIGQLALKDLIARPRPCHLDETVALLVTRPDSFSCPSTHSAWSFAAAVSIFLYHKKAGLIALLAAALIGFSRLYLFVHFPTDVLFGLVLGTAMGLLSYWILKKADTKMQAGNA